MLGSGCFGEQEHVVYLVVNSLLTSIRRFKIMNQPVFINIGLFYKVIY